jgi:hypothetical protein
VDAAAPLKPAGLELIKAGAPEKSAAFRFTTLCSVHIDSSTQLLESIDGRRGRLERSSQPAMLRRTLRLLTTTAEANKKVALQQEKRAARAGGHNGCSTLA